jgi:hypothetical protein
MSRKTRKKDSALTINHADTAWYLDGKHKAIRSRLTDVVAGKCRNEMSPGTPQPVLAN